MCQNTRLALLGIEMNKHFFDSKLCRGTGRLPGRSEKVIPALSVEQHTKILGYALLGYGISTFINSLGVTAVWVSATTSSRITAGTEVQIFLPILILLVSIWSSGVILSKTIRENLNLQSSAASLAFVFVAITSFPIGTLLSVYVLFYVFKINSFDGPEPSVTADEKPQDPSNESDANERTDEESDEHKAN